VYKVMTSCTQLGLKPICVIICYRKFQLIRSYAFSKSSKSKIRSCSLDFAQLMASKAVKTLSKIECPDTKAIWVLRIQSGRKSCILVANSLA
jgi:hypothetical protein